MVPAASDPPALTSTPGWMSNSVWVQPEKAVRMKRSVANHPPGPLKASRMESGVVPEFRRSAAIAAIPAETKFPVHSVRLKMMSLPPGPLPPLAATLSAKSPPPMGPESGRIEGGFGLGFPPDQPPKSENVSV